MQMLVYGIQFCEAPPHSFCANINASGSLDLFSYKNSRVLETFMHHAPQPRVAAAPKRFHIPIKPLRVEYVISSRDDISQTDLLKRCHSITVLCLNSLRSSKMTLFSQMFTREGCMARCFIYGNGFDS